MGFLLVFTGGGLGSLLRYGLSILLQSSGRSLPLATLSVNLVGCFLLGCLVASPMLSDRLSEPVRVGLGTGFLGGFTTFSTFGVESIKLFQNGEILVLTCYTAASVIGGFLAAYLGIRLVSC